MKGNWLSFEIFLTSYWHLRESVFYNIIVLISYVGKIETLFLASWKIGDSLCLENNLYEENTNTVNIIASHGRFAEGSTNQFMIFGDQDSSSRNFHWANSPDDLHAHFNDAIAQSDADDEIPVLGWPLAWFHHLIKLAELLEKTQITDCHRHRDLTCHVNWAYTERMI